MNQPASLTTWKPEVSPPPDSITAATITHTLHSKDASLATISEHIERGLEFHIFVALCNKFGLTQDEFAALLQVSSSTLYRRKKAGRFQPDESDRLWRYLHLYARALDVHEDARAAAEWLHAALPALGGQTPLEVSRDDPGVSRALAVLGRIEHGVFG